MSTNSHKYTLQPISHICLHWRGAVKVFRLVRPGSSCLLAVSVYVIFSDHISVALLAPEASFNPVAKKKILPAFSMLFAGYLRCLKGMSTKSVTYTLQPITHVYVVEEVPGRCRLACDRPVPVSEKQVSAVWLHECTQQLRHSRMNSCPLI